MLSLDLTIRTYGWQLNQVTDDNPWSYTIGLIESYDHPELMMCGVKLETQNIVIRKIVDSIEKTGSVDHAFLDRERVTLVEVHPNHLAGDWFGTWSNFYERHPTPGTFLQIAPPSDWFCDCHAHGVPHFELPGAIRFGNRADRRRRATGEGVRVRDNIAYVYAQEMLMTTSALRRDIYRILDRVLETGEPVIIERNGRRVRISAEEAPLRLDALVRRPDVVIGESEDFVHLDWSEEWTG